VGAPVGRVKLAAWSCSGSSFDRVPAENLRVSRYEFAVVWFHAENQHDDKVRRRVEDWYGAGVVVTCWWLACAMAHSSTRPRSQRHPGVASFNSAPIVPVDPLTRQPGT
jgi:hypothetical protein